MTQRFREENAPRWLLQKVGSLRNDQWLVPAASIALYTRAMAPHPQPRLRSRPVAETFEWVVQPADGMVGGEVYVDGSRLYAEHDLFGMCARIGYAIAIYDAGQNLVAAARGVPPDWIHGIHGAELFGLLMATQLALPGSSFVSDCHSVVKGCQNSLAWANAPTRRFARAWGPLVQAIEGQQVTWMPAHLSAAQDVPAALRRNSVILADGRTLSRHMVLANGFVDGHAKVAADTFRPLPCDLQLIRDEAARLKDIASWIGVITALANHYPAPGETLPGSKQKFIRDTEAGRPAGGRVRLMARDTALPNTVGTITCESPCGDLVELPAVSSAASHEWAHHSPQSGDTMRKNRAVSKCKAQVRADADGAELRLQDWLESRPAGRAPPIPAALRTEALRQRLAVKRRTCGCLCLGTPCACT